MLPNKKEQIIIARLLPMQTQAIDESCQLLAASFFSDPVLNWLVNAHRDRYAVAYDFFTMYLQKALDKGRVDIARCSRFKKIVGVTLYFPSDMEDTDTGIQIELNRACGKYTLLFDKFLKTMSKQYPVKEKPYQILSFVGVSASYQGMGIGSKLIKHALTEFDEQGTSTYLEASSIRSASGIYADLDYTMCSPPILFDGGRVKVYPMWREAQKKAC